MQGPAYETQITMLAAQRDSEISYEMFMEILGVPLDV